MRQSIFAAASLLLADTALAFEASGLSGEGSTATSEKRANGAVSSRMQAVRTSLNKYDTLIQREGLFEDRQQPSGFVDNIWELLTGSKPEQPGQRLKDALRTHQSAAASSKKQRLGQRSQSQFPSANPEIQLPLENLNGFMWTGEVYMGGNQVLDVVYDTGSDWLVIEGKGCDTCEGNVYDIQPSIDAGYARALTSRTSERNYGSASLVGREYTDRVCIIFSACVLDFEFFLIEQQTGIREPIDGILGLVGVLEGDEGNWEGYF